MKVTLICWSNEPHLSQIYTGLTLLHRERRIRLEQRIVAPPPPNGDPACPPHLRRANMWHCRIDANGRSLYVDVHDGDDVWPKALADCDVYLKRGYNSLKPMHRKVRPLGLNYEVYADGFDPIELERRFRLTGPWKAVKYVVRRPIGLTALEAPPSAAEPRVLFLCRAWEAEPGASAEKTAERVRINETRAACIMALRREFGDRCIAGFAHTAHAVTHFPHALALDPRLTGRRRYLRLVRSIPICVGTMGLHQSNGWKMGEYVAMSRAIACEPLRHYVPGLHAGQHYLPFDNAGECVEAVAQLMDSPAARRSMAEANRDYYLRRLRPDVAMLRALTETTEAPGVEPAARESERPCKSRKIPT
jgi:hypothetical protein